MTEHHPTQSSAALPAVADLRAKLPNLDRHLEAERLRNRHSEAITKAFVTQFFPDDLNSDIRFQQSAKAQLEALPSTALLAEVADKLNAAMTCRPDRKVAQAAVAVLFDSRVRGPQNPEIYLEALVFDLVDEGFAPAVVVAACQALRRESRFTPEIAEVLEACRKKAKGYESLASLAGRLCDARLAMEDAIRQAEAAPPPERGKSPARQAEAAS